MVVLCGLKLLLQSLHLLLSQVWSHLLLLLTWFHLLLTLSLSLQHSHPNLMQHLHFNHLLPLLIAVPALALNPNG